MPTIETLTQGSTPTLLQAEKGNELIEYVNSLMSSEGEEPIDVEVDSDGKMTVKLNGDYTTQELSVCVDGGVQTFTFLVQSS